ncbi:MAG: CCA tRNA nucleotidyltransferase [Anaerolineales bacterium]|nr:CCA tRNA nucleotidyltransferase [Anaerolineales bacterium]
MNLADLLKKSLDSSLVDLIHRVADESFSLGFPLYLVGGSVRDLMLGRPIVDLDLTLEGDAIKLGRVLVKKYGGDLTAHEKFFTATWFLKSPIRRAERSDSEVEASSLKSLDFASARRETYSHPGALPTVTKSTLDDDLRRRDFTINAMAIRVDGARFGELHDPLGGQKDLENKLIRILHPNSFIDDPTRMFRAVRYAVRYGFEIEPETLKLVNDESLKILSSLSGERLRHEFDLIFVEADYPSMLARLADMKILSAIGAPNFNESYASLIDELPEEPLGVEVDRVTLGYLLWLVDSASPKIQSLSERLAFTADLTDAVLFASTLKSRLPNLKNAKPSAWTFALEKYPLASIYGTYLMTNEQPLLDFLSKWRHVKPVTTGDDLKARGLAPGPKYGEILRRLRAAWLDGEVGTVEDEEKLVDLYSDKIGKKK